MNAAQRIVETRNIFHMNQTEFAKKIGITSSLVSQMERGVTPVSWKTAHAVETGLGISADWLMTGEGEVVSDQRKKADGPDVTAVLARFPAVAEVFGIFAGRMTLADWEMLNGICERVLGKQASVLDLKPAVKRGA